MWLDFFERMKELNTFLWNALVRCFWCIMGRCSPRWRHTYADIRQPLLAGVPVDWPIVSGERINWGTRWRRLH